MRGVEHRVISNIAVRAANQYGLVMLDQLRLLGVTRRQLSDLVREGGLHLLGPRVYAVAGAPPSIERRLMLGLLSLGPHAVVSHEAERLAASVTVSREQSRETVTEALGRQSRPDR